MGNAPLESNLGSLLKCCKCHKVLPPCTSHSNYYKQLLHNRNVYVFNGGQYFRPVGCDNAYECSDCFNQPIRDQDKRREEEERMRQEEVRRRQEEERRRVEEKRKEEERMKEKKGGAKEEQQLNIMDLLLWALDQLKQAELKRFKMHLSERTLEGYEPIPRGRLEASDATDVASIVMQAYGEGRSRTMVLTILRKMNLNNLADRLQTP